MKSTISIKDIARQSGVSIATVSRVINKTGRYSKETEEKVMSIIRDNNYAPNMIAKGLRVQKMMNVGIVAPDISNEFFTKLVCQIQRNLFREGYQTFLCNTDEDDEIERKQVRMMTQQNACGLLFLSSGNAAMETGLWDLPTVFIDRLPENMHPNCGMVCSDNVQGGFLATQELIQEGCKRILIVTSRKRVSGFEERYEGYVRALTESGRGQEDIHACYLDRLHYQDAYDELNRMIDAGEFDYDGIFAASDWLAIGCYRALEEHGYAVPGQVKIVGYDDISITAFNTVPISTVHQQVDILAKRATEQLIRIMQGEKPSQQVIHVPVYLLARQSTRGERAPKENR